MGILDILFGNYSKKEIKRLTPIVEKINSLEEELRALSDDALKTKTSEFRERLARGETLDDLLPEAFAVLREANVRETRSEKFPNGKRHFDVQLMGGIVLHQGRIAEMKTGEGKTQTALLPLYLNALEGKGVHLVTVNDYLARYHAQLAEKVFKRLGMTVGCVYPGMRDNRYTAYRCDVTYATNNELGFDYLRDNMAKDPQRLVQRELHFAIIDEVDSILIDEARTPLIISSPADTSTNETKRQRDEILRKNKFKEVQKFIRQQIRERGAILNEEDIANPVMRAQIQESGDYIIDEKKKAVTLTQRGLEKAQKYFSLVLDDDPDNPNPKEVEKTKTHLHYIDNALKANYGMEESVDYVKQEGKIIIVDTFTGRLMHGRRFSDGLHEAIEAKENVESQRETKTVATITFQNFFNKYTKKAGMTGTAQTEETEFREIYGMDVVVMEPNVPIQRVDQPDRVYRTLNAKYTAIVRDILECHEKGQPVLVGTVSVEISEGLHRVLKGEKNEIVRIPGEAGEGEKVVKIADDLFKYLVDNKIKPGMLDILNAINHKHEAKIIADAGQPGRITVATNMAGRGTDIMLGLGMIEEVEVDGKKVKQGTGLKVIGTERHESRRIDNQLRGRSGRQGDPGETRFYISIEDDLMRIFGGDRIKRVMDFSGIGEEELEHKMLSRGIEGAQKKVEGNNFGIRKNIREYDIIMNKQREIIYGERRKILDEYRKIYDKIGKPMSTYTNIQMLKKFAHQGDIIRRLRILDKNGIQGHEEDFVKYIAKGSIVWCFGGSHPDKLDIAKLNTDEALQQIFNMPLLEPDPREATDSEASEYVLMFDKWKTMTRTQITEHLLSEALSIYEKNSAELSPKMLEVSNKFTKIDIYRNLPLLLNSVIFHAVDKHIGNNELLEDWNADKLNSDENLQSIFGKPVLQLVDPTKGSRASQNSDCVLQIVVNSKEWSESPKKQLIDRLIIEAVKLYATPKKAKNADKQANAKKSKKTEMPVEPQGSEPTDALENRIPDAILNMLSEQLEKDTRAVTISILKAKITAAVEESGEDGEKGQHVYKGLTSNEALNSIFAADSSIVEKNMHLPPSKLIEYLYKEVEDLYDKPSNTSKLIDTARDLLEKDLFQTTLELIRPVIKHILSKNPLNQDEDISALNADIDLQIIFLKSLFWPEGENGCQLDYVFTPREGTDINRDELAEVLANKASALYATHKGYYFSQAWVQIVNDEQFRASDFMRNNVLSMLKLFVSNIVRKHISGEDLSEEWDIAPLNSDTDLKQIFGIDEKSNKSVLRPMKGESSKHEYVITLSQEEWEAIDVNTLGDKIYDEALIIYEQREIEYTPEVMRNAEGSLMLKAIDDNWESHIDHMDQMRQAIGLRSYAQRDPLVEYQILSHDMFEEMTTDMQADTILELFDEKLDEKLKLTLQRKERVLYTNSAEGNVRKPRRVEKKLNVNDDCHCGSGKKYKKCCMRADEQKRVS